MVSITHKYVSANGDPPDSSLIGQTKWNDDHNVVGLTPGVDIQAYSANLDSWSLVAPGSYLTVAAAAASYQPLASALTSWASVSRASGFDTFAATPSSANLRSLLTDETGTGAAVFANTPTLVSPVLGTPTSGNLANCTAYPLAQLSGSGTGVLTALGVNVGSAGSFVIFNGALGTPSSGTLTNCSGLPISGIASLGTGIGTWLSTPSSANLASAITDETGSGSLVFASAPTLTNPVVGTQSALDNSTKAASTAYVDRTTRQVLTANQTYYVRTNGSDSNNGLANTSGGAFLTIQKAVDTACSLDLSIYNVTINVADGTYAGGVVLKPYLGTGPIAIVGNTASPGNCLLQGTGSRISAGNTFATYQMRGFETQTITSGNSIGLSGAGILELNNWRFGPCAGSHMRIDNGARLNGKSGSFEVAANATYFAIGGYFANIDFNSATVTFSANVTFTATAYAQYMAMVNFQQATFNLGAFTVTGQRYNASGNSLISSGGAGASFIPGSTVGAVASGGTYL